MSLVFTFNVQALEADDAATISRVDTSIYKPAANNEFYNETEYPGQNFCKEPGVRKVVRLAGYFIAILRIAVPLIIIIAGGFIFFKAVVSDSDKDLKKSAIIFGKKVAAGMLVFFVPTLLEAMFSLYNNFAEVESEYTECASCLNNPGDCKIAVGSTEGDVKIAPNCSTIGLADCNSYVNCKVGGPAPGSGSTVASCQEK